MIVRAPRVDVADAGDWAELTQRITRDHAYLDLVIARDVVRDDAPAFAHVDRVVRGPELGTPHAIDWVEIFVVSRGHGRFLSPRGSVPVGPGTVVVLRPGAWGMSVDCDLESAGIVISPVVIATEFAFLRQHPGARELLYPSARAINGVVIVEIDPHAAAVFGDEVERLRVLLAERRRERVVLVGQLMVAIGVLAHALPGAPASTPHPAVEAALRLVDAEPERPWRLTELARAVAVHPGHLVRLFRTEVGTPPMAYLNRVRAERAAGLLREGRLSVAQIGAAVGWPDATHFSRRFRELFGVAPRRYRDQLRRPLVPRES